ncbi:MAG: hypothetical protein H6942_15320 [Candidatus Accumulibacter sp.]|uniref:hypothetical protein n=1 Tax=Accumulibacter sp. TaxID=2053492 RepID=UPI001D40F6B4|nr:hypothetical protein [Accumulibacter sp.]MCB1942278.1 hypothetical protein [Accumulibacter sp.]MCP5249882.1 hypothetical protein [Accumulibacter sp.]
MDIASQLPAFLWRHIAPWRRFLIGRKLRGTGIRHHALRPAATAIMNNNWKCNGFTWSLADAAGSRPLPILGQHARRSEERPAKYQLKH